MPVPQDEHAEAVRIADEVSGKARSGDGDDPKPGLRERLGLKPRPKKPKAVEEFSPEAPTMGVVKARDKEQDIALKKILAWASVGFVTLQLLAANAFFGFYLWHAREQTPEAIMMAWLSATVIEVIAILGIIARSLFPGRRRRKSKRRK